MSKAKVDFAAVMAAKTNGRRRSHTQVCFSSELDSEFEQLGFELRDALAIEQAASGPKDPDKVNTKRRLAGDELASKVIAQKMASLMEANPEAFYELEFEALERDGWLALRDQHPPRDGNTDDQGMFNSATFGPAAIEACLVDPEPSAEVMAFFASKLSTGEWERLSMLVWSLNEGGREAPKLDLALSILNGNAAG